MKLTRVYPGAPETIELDAPGSRERLLDLYRPPSPTWLRLNLIASVDGNAAGVDGTSESLTNIADRRILGVIREISDVVLIGAGSVRREGYLLPRRARLAVVTGTGDLTGHRIDPAAGQGPVIVLCPPAAVGRVRETIDDRISEVISVGTSGDAGHLAMSDVVGALRDLSLFSIVCEGGPQLAGQLLTAELVDEACFSTSPLVGGTRLPMLETPSGMARVAELTQLLVDDSSGLYARWAVR